MQPNLCLHQLSDGMVTTFSPHEVALSVPTSPRVAPQKVFWNLESYRT